MNEVLEAAANDIRAAHFVAYVRAAIGCEHCDGRGFHVTYPDPGEKLRPYGTFRQESNCPAEHAVITVLGETIYADTEKCEWVCRGTVGAIMCGTDRIGVPRYHERCGCQPRWSLLAGGE